MNPPAPNADGGSPHAESHATLPAELAERVLGQLEAGERIVWCAQPAARTLMCRELGFIAIVAVIALVGLGPGFAGWMVYGLAQIGLARLGPEAVTAAQAILLPLPAFAVLALATVHARVRANNTAYLVTDRRAMIVSTRPTRKTAAYAPEDLAGVELRRRRDGAADIILARGPAGRKHGATWNMMYGVEEAEGVMRLILAAARRAG